MAICTIHTVPAARCAAAPRPSRLTRHGHPDSHATATAMCARARACVGAGVGGGEGGSLVVALARAVALARQGAVAPPHDGHGPAKGGVKVKGHTAQEHAEHTAYRARAPCRTRRRAHKAKLWPQTVSWAVARSAATSCVHRALRSARGSALMGGGEGAVYYIYAAMTRLQSETGRLTHAAGRCCPSARRCCATCPPTRLACGASGAPCTDSLAPSPAPPGRRGGAHVRQCGVHVRLRLRTLSVA